MWIICHREKHLPYATDTLQVEPPETTDRLDGVFFAGDVCRLNGGMTECPGLASSMGTVRVIRLLAVVYIHAGD